MLLKFAPGSLPFLSDFMALWHIANTGICHEKLPRLPAVQELRCLINDEMASLEEAGVVCHAASGENKAVREKPTALSS